MPNLLAARCIVVLLFFFVVIPGSRSQTSDERPLRNALIIKGPPNYNELVAPRDPIEESIVRGTWTAPKESLSVRYNDTASAQWLSARADSNGWFTQDVLSRAYVYCSVHSDGKEIMLLEGMGHSMVYVNGEPRSGNPYGVKDTYDAWETKFNYSLIPVQLEEGNNDLLFYCNRGVLKVRFVKPRGDAQLNVRDATLPDLVAGRPFDVWASVVVMNPSLFPWDNLVLKAAGKEKESATPLPVLPAMSVRKVGFKLTGTAPESAGEYPVTLSLIRKDGAEWVKDTASVVLRVVAPSACRKETFISGIDGSVQYYAVNPPAGDTVGALKPALFLSLHGASVEAINQASSYYPKSWGAIVAPTNRRPYGFNWEDWGRLDALEALQLAKKEFNVDESRVYLTGHSMGGHGAYHLGVLYPDQFAAVGPSAGWISFWSYGRGTVEHPTPMQQMLMRASLQSRTDTLLPNLSQEGVYILQGGADDNVPPEQARSMNERLSRFHKDYVYFEQKDAGHWWDNSDEPGADCVDWAPMFDFFARHARPAPSQIRQVDFITPNPGVSAQDYWLLIDAQQEPLRPSEVHLRFDPGMRRFSGTTRNVQRMLIDCVALGLKDSVRLDIDSQKIGPLPLFPNQKALWLEWNYKIWNVIQEPLAGIKNARRNGTFKDAFRNRVIFVYGTRGSDSERTWAFGKARFDAERLWYQGNASIDVVSDADFHPEDEIDRNVVLYGNAFTNAAWQALLGGSPVQVEQGSITVGNRTFTGADLGCAFIQPRPGSAVASVGVVAGTGLTGMKLTNRMLYLQPGIGFPDCVVAGVDLLSKGEEGVRAAGFFGPDWSVEKGEFIYK